MAVAGDDVEDDAGVELKITPPRPPASPLPSSLEEGEGSDCWIGRPVLPPQPPPLLPLAGEDDDEHGSRRRAGGGSDGRGQGGGPTDGAPPQRTSPGPAPVELRRRGWLASCRENGSRTPDPGCRNG